MVNVAVTEQEKSLSKRSMNSSAWTLGGHISIQLFRFAANLIMARLLVPEMFGVMTLAGVFIFGLTLFSDIGLAQNIVQSKRGDEQQFLDTVWVTQIMRGVLIFIVGSCLSVLLIYLVKWQMLPLDSTYAHEDLPAVLVALSFNAVISGFQTTKIATAERDLAVKKLRIVEFSCHLIGIVFMLTWAWFDRSVWALVASALFSTTLKNIVAIIYLPGKNNHFSWNKEDFTEIFSFGKWVFVSSIMGFLCISADRLLLGGMMSKELFGQYAITVLIFLTGKEMFTKMYSSVVFPAISEVNRLNPDNVKKTYYKFRLISDSLLMFGAGCLYATAELIMHTLYDERYSESGWMLQILALSLIGYRYEVTNKSLTGMGKPKYEMMMNMANMVVLFTMVPLANHFYGSTGALWMIALSSIVTMPLIFKFKLSHGLFDWKNELKTIPLLPVGYVVGLGIVAIATWIKAL